MARRPEDLTYAVDEMPPWHRLVVLGLQHALLISIYLVFVVIIARKANVTEPVIANTVSVAMLVIGIATILQSLRVGPMGSGYLAPPVYSAIYLGPSVLAAKVGGLPAVFGMTIFAAVIEIVLSRYLHRMRAVFPPALSGFVVLIVGIDLGLVGLSQVLELTGYNDPKFTETVCVALFTVAVIVVLSVWVRGIFRLMCSMFGIVSGFIAAFAVGLISENSLAAFEQAQGLAFPLPGFDYSFDLSLMPSFFAAGLAAALRTIGVITTCEKINDADWKRPDLGPIKGGMLADGLGCLTAGILGAPGLNAGPSLVGVSKATGATSRYIAYAAGGLLILFAFLPKLSFLFLLLPLPVAGAALLVNSCFMIAGGIQVMVSRNVDSRVTYIIGFSLLLGLSREVFPAYFEQLPAFLHVFTGTLLSLSVLVAIMLNLLFRLGIRRTEMLDLEGSEVAPDKVAGFLSSKGRSWGIPRDLMDRSITTTTQVFTHLQDARLIQGKSKITVSYDDVTLLIQIDYEGQLLSLPNVGIKKNDFLEEEAFAYGLADFLTGVYPDRFESSSRGQNATLRFYYNP